MGLYIINREVNEMKEVTPTTFKEIGARERFDLQEWIVNTPDCLGEKLLIIAKEFDDFDGTRERSDLLALDESGRLVVIENKLDDSGRDVVWQALKYAAYYSDLTTTKIVSIYADYEGVEQDQANNDIDSHVRKSGGERKLNSDNNPRICLIAANFRKEVTATALWLRDQNIDIRCHTAIPYILDGKPYLRIEQLIPIPQADDFKIKVAEKAPEEEASSNARSRRHDRRRRFWKKVLDNFQRADFRLYDSINPTRDYWLSKTAGISGVNYQMQFLMKKIAVELRIAGNDKDKNKRVYDALVNHKADIDSEFHGLTWDRRDDEIMSVIKIEKPTDDSWEDESAWDGRIDWLRENVKKMHSVTESRLAQVRNEIRY